MKIFVSVSGGKSSMMMARVLRDKYPAAEIVYVFANTGQEREETLAFVAHCAEYWSMPIVWVEASIQSGRIGTGHKIVTFETASRHGEPFESMITKYGIPNKAYPHCTRELKLAPMYSYRFNRIH